MQSGFPWARLTSAAAGKLLADGSNGLPKGAGGRATGGRPLDRSQKCLEFAFGRFSRQVSEFPSGSIETQTAHADRESQEDSSFVGIPEWLANHRQIA